MDSLNFELQIVFCFQLFLSADVRHRFLTLYVFRVCGVSFRPYENSEETLSF